MNLNLTRPKKKSIVNIIRLDTVIRVQILVLRIVCESLY